MSYEGGHKWHSRLLRKLAHLPKQQNRQVRSMQQIMLDEQVVISPKLRLSFQTIFELWFQIGGVPNSSSDAAAFCAPIPEQHWFFTSFNFQSRFLQSRLTIVLQRKTIFRNRVHVLHLKLTYLPRPEMKFWISAVRFHRRWGWQQRRAFGWRLAVTLSLIYPGVSYCSRLQQWFLSKQAISFLIPPQPQPHPRQEERRRIPTKAMLSTAASWRNEAKRKTELCYLHTTSSAGLYHRVLSA